MILLLHFHWGQDKPVGKNPDTASIYGDYWLILIKEKQQWETRSWLNSQSDLTGYVYIKCCSSWIGYLSSLAPRIITLLWCTGIRTFYLCFHYSSNVSYTHPIVHTSSQLTNSPLLSVFSALLIQGFNFLTPGAFSCLWSLFMDTTYRFLCSYVTLWSVLMTLLKLFVRLNWWFCQCLSL